MPAVLISVFMTFSASHFTVQLQHHAQHRLPTFQLIFVHVIESLVFVPVIILLGTVFHDKIFMDLFFSPLNNCLYLQIMIGILFFLFEFYDDQLLAFMVLILVWLCELFTLIRFLSFLYIYISVYVFVSGCVCEMTLQTVVKGLLQHCWAKTNRKLLHSNSEY